MWKRQLSESISVSIQIPWVSIRAATFPSGLISMPSILLSGSGNQNKYNLLLKEYKIITSFKLRLPD